METNAPLFSRILVPQDGSTLATHAIPVARGLAAPGSTIILCRIVADAAQADDGGAYPASVAENARREADASLRAVAARYLSAGDVRVQIATAAGEPGACIVALAQERAAQMIVMASHSRSGGGRVLFGSVADHVSRTAPVPVVVVHPAEGEAPVVGGGVRRLVVPLDETPLSQQAIPVAAALARRRRLPVLLISAVDPAQVESPIAGYAAAMSDRAYHKVMGTLKHDALGQLERFGARLMRAGVVATWRLLAGPPARVIPAVLCAGDLVVMASHRRDGLERWWRGSLAEELIQSGGAPVMVVGAMPAPIPVDSYPAAEHVSHA